MKKYIINVLSYLGIGFIWWAISHWFFSETRSIIMAILWIIIFLIAELLKDEETDYINTIVFWLLYSVSIWMISWWFQHFLDSPTRSIWIIPVWFILWYIIYIYKNNRNDLTSKSTVYAITIGIILFVLWYGAYKMLPHMIQFSSQDHHNKSNNIITDPNQDIQNNKPAWMKWWTDEAILEHCQMMPTMEWCQEILSQTPNQDMPNNNTTTHEMDHWEMVNTDFDFVYLMIPHHQEAVDTSKRFDKYPSSDSWLQELDQIAKNIVSWQDQEIQMMKWRLQKRYSGNIYTGMWYMNMMRPLDRENASWSTETLKIQRAEDMITHHQWAIDMANKLLIILQNKWLQWKFEAEYGNYLIELREFANNVIKAQTEEIDRMKSIISNYQSHH